MTLVICFTLIGGGIALELKEGLLCSKKLIKGGVGSLIASDFYDVTTCFVEVR
ncbi:MAG: hypothetical protein WBV93_18480 [Anaerobacillus sp.]